MAIRQRQMTLEEFLELPEEEEETSLEYFEGRITQKVPAKLRHSALQAEVTFIFNEFARPRRLARAFPELRTTFAQASLVPDVAVLRWERIPRLETGEMSDDVFVPPDIAVEIVSPGQGINRLIHRCHWFLDHGAELALLINPRDKTVRRFQSGQPDAVLRGSDHIDLDSVLPGFDLTVDRLFDALIV